MESVKEMIEKRAYHLFLKRNGAHGYHMQDWIQAEKEIKAELEAGKKTAVKPAAAVKIEPPKTAPVPAPKAAVPAAEPVSKARAAVKGNKKR